MKVKIYEEVNSLFMDINWEKCFLCGDNGDHNCHMRGYGADFEAYCENTNKKIYLNVNFEKYTDIWPEIAGYISNNVPSGTRIAEYSEGLLESNEMLIPDIIKKIPKKMDQLYTLLNFLEGKLKNIFSVEYMSIPPYLVYCDNEYEVEGHIGTLKDLGYVKVSDWHECCLTAKGLEKLEDLRKSNKDSNKVFIAMKFDTEYSESIKNATKKGCGEIGLVAESVDEKKYVGDVNDRIISEINKSKFVVADYTLNNSGVYYESGYARGRGITVIETCNKTWLDSVDNGIKNKLHFDVEHRNMIMWKDEGDLCAKVRDRIGSLL